MLVRFNVGNFLSFKDVQEFSMLKGKPRNNSDRLYKANNVNLLKFASVFGANAAGKSNLVKSIQFAQSLIIAGNSKKCNNFTYKLDKNYANKPSYFEFEIIIDGINYAYGFEVLLNEKKFVSEWLIKLMPNEDNTIVFERDIENLRLDSDLTIESTDLSTRYNVYKDEFKQNANLLFLSEMNRAKTEIYKENSPLNIYKQVYNWFTEVLDINYPDSPISNYSYFHDVDNKNEICRIIKCFGTGITNYTEERVSLDALKKELPLPFLEQLNEDIDDLEHDKDAFSSIYIKSSDKFFIVTPSNNGNLEVTTIEFNHGNEALFSIGEESDGTRRILELLEILLTDEEKVFVIDEIDRSLHPQLTYKFVSEFLQIAKKKNTQLIITTHESRLMDFGLLRQDEIWIANKNYAGDTALYSLDEYNVRFDKKVDKAYLEGRYGGVPIFKTIFPLQEE